MGRGEATDSAISGVIMTINNNDLIALATSKSAEEVKAIIEKKEKPA